MTQFFLRKCLLLIALTIAISSQSQQSDSTVTIIFSGNHSSKKAKEEKAKKMKYYNAIKVAPTGFFIGAFPIIYERKIFDNLSIQASIGLTNRNYMRGAFKRNTGALGITSFPWPSGVSGNDRTDDIYTFKVRQAQSGTMFTIQPKFYANGEALSGFYFGVSYDHYNYKFQTPQYVVGTSGSYTQTGSMQNESETISDYMLHLGLQKINKHIIFEVSAAAGIRKVDGIKYVATFDNNNKNFYDGFVTYKEQGIPNVELALRVGYTF